MPEGAPKAAEAGSGEGTDAALQGEPAGTELGCSAEGAGGRAAVEVERVGADHAGDDAVVEQVEGLADELDA